MDADQRPFCYHLAMLSTLRPAGAAVVALLLAAPPLQAHPGPGIVVDSHGTVYFVVAGSNQVMRLRRAEGKPSVFIDDERIRLPHHLVLGRDGSLYLAADHDGRIWRADTAGKLSEYFNSSRVARPPGAPELHVGFGGEPFTLDAAGNVYALGTRRDSTLVRITSDGHLTPVAPGTQFGGLHFSSMTVGSDGVLHVSDGGRVWRVLGDTAVAITPKGAGISRITGLAVDDLGNIYAADYLGGRVVRFAQDGSVNTPSPLEQLEVKNPMGLTLANGSLFVLASPPGITAIWEVGADGARRLYHRRAPTAYLPYLMVALPLLLVVLLVLRFVERRRIKLSSPGRDASPPH